MAIVVPHLGLIKTGTVVHGESTINYGYCGNGRPQQNEVNGTWNGTKVDLSINGYGGNIDVNLKGTQDVPSGVIRGTASFADGSKRKFALIPGSSGHLSNYDMPKLNRTDDKPYPELKEADELRKYAQHISVMHFPKALSAMQKSMAIYNRLPSDDIRKLEAQMHLVHFYLNANLKTTDGGESNLCGYVDEGKEALGVVQKMIDTHDPSWDTGNRGQRLISVIQDATQFYTHQSKFAEVDMNFEKVIAIYSKGKDPEHTIPKALERWADATGGNAKKEQLKLKALAYFDKIYPLGSRISVRNGMILWYLMNDMPEKANLQVQEVARILGMPDTTLRISTTAQ